MFGTIGRMLGGMFGVGDDLGRSVAGAVGLPTSGKMPVGAPVPMEAAGPAMDPGAFKALLPSMEGAATLPYFRGPDGPAIVAPEQAGGQFRDDFAARAADPGNARMFGGMPAPPSMMQPPRPMAGLSTVRPQQTLGGMLWPGYGYGWGWGQQQPRAIESQLPMGRASATGSIPFMQNGRGWGGRY